MREKVTIIFQKYNILRPAGKSGGIYQKMAWGTGRLACNFYVKKDEVIFKK